MWRVLCALLVVSSSCQAEPADKVTLKKFVDKAGDRVRVTRTSESVSTSILDFLGEKKTRVEKSSESEVFVTEILTEGKPGEMPAKLKRHYEKSERTFGGQSTKLPIEGKTIFITYQDGKYVFGLESGGPVTGITSLLDAEFNRRPMLDYFGMFFPNHAVQAGQSWDVKTAFLSAFERPFVFDRSKTTGSAKLVRTSAKEGALHGILEVRVESPLAGIDGFPADVIKAGSKIDWDWNCDGCIDGASPNCQVIHTMKSRTIMDLAEESTVSKSTRTVELLPKK